MQHALRAEIFGVHTWRPADRWSLETRLTWETSTLEFTGDTDQTGYTPASPYGACDGTNSLACSWQYGWTRAVAILDG